MVNLSVVEYYKNNPLTVNSWSIHFNGILIWMGDTNTFSNKFHCDLVSIGSGITTE